MATSILGRIKQIHKGTYNAGTAYKVDDIVEYTDTNIKGTASINDNKLHHCVLTAGSGKNLLTVM